MDHANIIKEAWKTARNNQKLVWFWVAPTFSFLLNFDFSSLTATILPWLTLPKFMGTSFLSEVQKTVFYHAAGTSYSPEVCLFLLSLLIYLVTFLMNILVSPAILVGLRMARKNETQTYGSILRHALHYYKPFLLWGIATILPSILINMIEVVLRAKQNPLAISALRCLNLPIMVFISLISFVVPVLIVFEERNLISSIKRSWKDFVKPHFGNILLLIILSGFVFLLLIIGFILLCVPLFLILRFASAIENTSSGTILLLMLCYSPIFTAGFGFLGVFYQSIQVEFYEHIKTKEQKNAGVESEEES